MPSPKFAFPGQRLTVEEEYAAGQHTFVDEEGNVVSSMSGEVLFDEDGREVQIVPKNPNHGLDVGSIVLGRVQLVKDAVVILNIGYAEKDGQPRTIYDTSAVLGVARASREFVRSLKEHFSIGDFVRAKVSGITPYSIEVSTNEKGLGKVLSRQDVVKHMNPHNERFPVDDSKKKMEKEW